MLAAVKGYLVLMTEIPTQDHRARVACHFFAADGGTLDQVLAAGSAVVAACGGAPDLHIVA